MPGSVYLIDKDDKYINCNTNLVRMLGASSREEVIGKTSEDMSKAFEWTKAQTRDVYLSNQSVRTYAKRMETSGFFSC